MGITIYHNPRCSKSRKTLEIIRSSGVEPTIVPYLEEPPDGAAILDIAGRLGLSVAELLRRGENAVKQADDLPGLDDDQALAHWIASHPIALQRPIVLDTGSGRAVIGRPPENVAELIS
ncbi:MAG: arsenate reductase (glutaredoxin) [Gammaproteobacteria bacterium]|nr:arsenate reductase (glutaredoxin) [Gammaproteobacteria bacterium]